MKPTNKTETEKEDTNIVEQIKAIRKEVEESETSDSDSESASREKSKKHTDNKENEEDTDSESEEDSDESNPEENSDQVKNAQDDQLDSGDTESESDESSEEDSKVGTPKIADRATVMEILGIEKAKQQPKKKAKPEQQYYVIFVGNLSYKTTEADLAHHFLETGNYLVMVIF